MKRIRSYSWLVVAACCVLIELAGCQQADNQSPAPAAPRPKSPAADAQPTKSQSAAVAPNESDDAGRLQPIELGAARPVHQFGRYYLGGQPAEADLAAWKERGVRTVISLRTPGEIDWDEKAAVESQGMKFVSIPFRGADTLGDQQIEEALAALADDANGPILLHCATSNRVGAIWYAHRIRHDGLSAESALAEARRIGLRNTSLTDVVNAYCERAGQPPENKAR
jgi:uncharacterized protein (TIGR01244 family)